MLGWNKKSNIDPTDEHRDFRLLENIVADAFTEQKKTRMWGNIFKGLTFLYLFAVLVVFHPAFKKLMMGGGSDKPHTAVVVINGPIMADKPTVAWKINASLRNAFENEHSKAVIIGINSPGGSPVQSAYIYDEIRRLREEYPDKKVYAVIADLCASGGYYIASAADEIYANRSSLVGSIGVTGSGFGFVDLMEKVGVERRHYTAGENKAFLDPFSPKNEKQTEFWQSVLDKTHDQFVDAVKQGRGDRLKITEEITSGLIWNGEQALEVGLIDGLGSASYVAREIVGEEKLVSYTIRERPLERVLKSFGVSVGEGVAQYFMSSSYELNTLR